MSAPLLAAAGHVDITPDPPEGVYLAGFAPNRTALGVRDPLEAGVLVLRVGEATLTLVTVDLIGLGRHVVERVRARVTGVPGEGLVICATHTHSGPDTLGLWGPTILGIIPRRSGVDPAYLDLLVARISEAIDACAARLEPACLKAASFEVAPEWTRNDRTEGARDDHAVALAVERPGGERLATLLNFASHPETLWEKNRQISPDFPGAFRRTVRARGGGVPLYFSGDLGGMLTPNVAPKADQAARDAYVEDLGRALAEQTLAELDAAAALPAPAIALARAEVVLPVENWRFRLGHRMGVLERAIEDRTITSEVNAITIGGIQAITVPGEALPELGARLRGELMSGEHRLLLCLGCDELGYILEPEMFDRRHYAYEQTMSMGRNTATLIEGALRGIISDTD